MKTIIHCLLITLTLTASSKLERFHKTHLKPMEGYAHVLMQVRSMMSQGNTYRQVMDLIDGIEAQL